MSTVAVGVFAGAAEAAQARARLVAEGVGLERITLSSEHSADDIAAEAPGQSYEQQNPSDSTAAAKADARHNTLLRTGGCALSVTASSREESARLRAVMERAGAHATLERPG
ncbi:MAG TPA: hypothetical protein VM183_01280 [Burkholderiales bacterium]|nr:hypothetical protein [Burkholderiales bacterium]